MNLLEEAGSLETLNRYLCCASSVRRGATVEDAEASACIVCSIHCSRSFIGMEDSLTIDIHIMEHPRSKGWERPLGQIS